jgi:glycosyltransferase involved in cell wall biosynthesis
MNLRAYVLAKNEEPNIGRCVKALLESDIPVIVLDSGSTDRTVDIASGLGAQVERLHYTTHLNALEHICTARTETEEYVIVLDADTRVSRALMKEATGLLADADVIVAPVAMVYDGVPLRMGSLYPSKPFLFRRGRHYFEASGHGERLRPDVKSAVTNNKLVHDDRKGFDAFILTQLRNSASLLARARAGHLSFRDKLRMRSPVMAFLVPFVSYVLRGGMLCGKAGLAYAIDRVICETIMFRRLSELQMGAVTQTEAEQPERTYQG